MKFVSKIIFLTQWENPGGPPKDLRGPLEGRGPPVEKHWFRGFRTIDIANNLINTFLVTGMSIAICNILLE